VRSDHTVTLTLGVPWAPSGMVKQLVVSGCTLQAIKQYRVETGCSLAEARQVVEGARASTAH
jgi:hypothetical protein